MNNITPSIHQKRWLKLHNDVHHPICLMKQHIQYWFKEYELYDNLPEVVSIKDNFDDLLFPEDHPARSLNDTYYLNDQQVLRTHTSAHQNEILKKGSTRFLVTGDVYRKDTIDRTHYPVFHQMEGVCVLPAGTDALEKLKETLSGLMQYLYPGREYRYLDDYFPFTNPSIQLEVKSEQGWMEVLGAGVIQPKILENCGIKGTGWAFGLGIDRLLMHWCSIPDIRYVWSMDDRFLLQFRNGLQQFNEYSRYPSTNRDISFWINDYKEDEDGIWEGHHNFCEFAREIGKDLIESINLLDKYSMGATVSLAYRIVYHSHDRTLTNEEINQIQASLRESTEKNLHISLR